MHLASPAAATAAPMKASNSPCKHSIAWPLPTWLSYTFDPFLQPDLLKKHRQKPAFPCFCLSSVSEPIQKKERSPSKLGAHGRSLSPPCPKWHPRPRGPPQRSGCPAGKPRVVPVRSRVAVRAHLRGVGARPQTPVPGTHQIPVFFNDVKHVSCLNMS